MNLFEALGVAGWAWRCVVKVIHRPSVWAPILVIAAIQAIALLLLVFFHHPRLVAVGRPLVVALGGEGATHYPEHLYALPSMVEALALGITVLVVPIAVGAATARFAITFGFSLQEGPWRLAFRAAPKLIFFMLLMLGFEWGATALFGLIPEELRLNSTKIRLGLLGVGLLISILVQMLLAYATAWVVLRGHSTWAALRDSMGTTFKTLLATLILVAVPAGLMFPFTVLFQGFDLVETGIVPETIASLMGASLVAETVLRFFLVGSITFVFGWRSRVAS